MWDISEIEKYIKDNIKESRYKHTLGVIETAKKLANINGVDENKAHLAALMHDSAKNMPSEKMIEILNEENIKLDLVSKESPQILHGKVGAIIAKKVFEIEDEDILNAIEYHTTGRSNMSTLEKIVYIADYIEPNRNYPGVDELREITFEDLDKGVLKGLDNTLIFVIKEENLIHPLTIEARNFMLLEVKTKQ